MGNLTTAGKFAPSWGLVEIRMLNWGPILCGRSADDLVDEGLGLLEELRGRRGGVVGEGR